MLVGLDTLRDRAEGRRNNGTVTLADFDRGFIETLGARVWHSPTSMEPLSGDCDPEVEEDPAFPGYFVQVPGVSPPPGLPGVPVSASFPEELFQRYQMPVFWWSRESIDPAMNRWHPGAHQFRAPSAGALPVTDSSGALVGFDRHEDRQQAAPFDLSYVLNIESRLGVASRQAANALFMFAIRVWQPYSYLALRDSLGDVRTYSTFMESSSNLDEVGDVTKRKIGFTLNIRVEAELDLLDPEVRRSVTESPTFNLSPN